MRVLSNSLPLACIDDLQLGDCRSEGYEINLKVLDKAASLCTGILEGEPKTLGAAAIAYLHTALGAAQAWLEQLKGRCEAVAANYIIHEAANSLCIQAIAHMEEKLRNTKAKVCELQGTLGIMETLGGMVKEEVGGQPLAYLQYPFVRRQHTLHKSKRMFKEERVAAQLNTLCKVC